MNHPNFKGKGEHSVKELEQICTDYEEYRYQQQLIKQDMLSSLITVKKIMITPSDERPIGWVRSFLQGYGGESIEKATK